MGLPGKPKGFDGGEVERYFREGKLKDVADYCETDVVGTYQVWLRYELFRGSLSQNAFEGSERNLADFVRRRAWEAILLDTKGAFRLGRERDDEVSELPNPLPPRRAINWRTGFAPAVICSARALWGLSGWRGNERIGKL
jgi:Predicted 3'-5' exonuclease related to the exonuclease domain of PolB